MGTAGCTSAAGDVLYQQAFERRGEQHQWYRTRRLALFGCFAFAPVANRWHLLLSKVEFSSMTKTVIARVVIDQSVFAPFATCWFYLVLGGVFENRPIFTAVSKGLEKAEKIESIQERLTERLWSTVQLQWCVFGPGQIINFTFLPLQLRPPFMSLISLFWSCFLASSQTILPEGAAQKDIGSESNLVLIAEIIA